MNINILNRKNGKRPKGFTLIELLVVVIIIGILAAIAVPIFLNQRKAAWKASAVSDASNATLAIESSRTQTGTLDGVAFGGGKNGQPMTITMGSETTKATVSPGNSETAWVSKTPSGEPCYAVMTTNANVPSWAAVRTSEGSMTTGTPPANGSADCPKPSASSSLSGVLEMNLASTTGTTTVSCWLIIEHGAVDGGPGYACSTQGGTPAMGEVFSSQTGSAIGDAGTGIPGLGNLPAVVSVNGSTPIGGTLPWTGKLAVLLEDGSTISIDVDATNTATIIPPAAS